MEPQDVNTPQPEQAASVSLPVNPAVSQPITQPAQVAEAPKFVPEEPPVILNWKRPIITMLIIGVIAVVIMLLAKNL
jgi:hypothetical protein